MKRSQEVREKLSRIQKELWKRGIYNNRPKPSRESVERGREKQRRGTFIECIICKKPFYCSPSSIKRGRKFCSKKCNGLYYHDENNPNWNNGNSRCYKMGYYSAEYKEWRKSVFTRDNYTCQKCNAKFYITAHHIKSFSFFPELRYEINNGITLCEGCHSMTDNYKRHINIEGVNA